MPARSRKLSWWGKKHDLHTLLVKFNASEATDERDKIYALLGISSDARNSKQLLPDYHKSTQQLIHDTWSYLLFNEILDPSLHGFPCLSMEEFIQILRQLPKWTAEWSLREGRDEIVLRLYGKGVYATPRMKADRALLRALAGFPDHDDLFERMVLHDKLKVNVVDDLGDTPLHSAIRTGNHNKVEMLLRRKDILLNGENLKYKTPLVEAIEHGSLSMINMLLAHPHIDVNGRDQAQTPIIAAIRLGNEALMKALLARPDIKLNRSGSRPLVAAVHSRRCEILRQLLDSGLIDLNYTRDGEMAYRKAVKVRCEESQYILLRHMNPTYCWQDNSWKVVVGARLGFAGYEIPWDDAQKIFGVQDAQAQDDAARTVFPVEQV